MNNRTVVSFILIRCHDCFSCSSSLIFTSFHLGFDCVQWNHWISCIFIIDFRICFPSSFFVRFRTCQSLVFECLYRCLRHVCVVCFARIVNFGCILKRRFEFRAVWSSLIFSCRPSAVGFREFSSLIIVMSVRFYRWFSGAIIIDFRASASMFIVCLHRRIRICSIWIPCELIVVSRTFCYRWLNCRALQSLISCGFICFSFVYIFWV